MKLRFIIGFLLIGLCLNRTAAAQPANKVNVDAALSCLQAGTTSWSFLPHSEEQTEWTVIVVDSNAALRSSEPRNVGALELPKNADTPFILKCANVPQLLKADKADWNSFVEKLSIAVENKSLRVMMFKVRRPTNGQEVAPHAMVPLGSKDLVRVIGRQ